MKGWDDKRHERVGTKSVLRLTGVGVPVSNLGPETDCDDRPFALLSQFSMRMPEK